MGGWCPCQGGGHGCAALGEQPTRTAEAMLLALTPHFLLPSDIPVGPSCGGAQGALSPPSCFECALQGRWRRAERPLPPSATRPGTTSQ